MISFSSRLKVCKCILGGLNEGHAAEVSTFTFHSDMTDVFMAVRFPESIRSDGVRQVDAASP